MSPERRTQREKRDASKELEAIEKTRLLRFVPRSYGSKSKPELVAAAADAATRHQLPLSVQLDVVA